MSEAKRSTLPTECWQIDPPRESRLDRIHVFWLDFAPNVGQVTVVCWGQAWSAYFGGMGCDSIRDFFASCDTGYMVSKLGITQFLKQSKKHEDYLGRIVDAIKAAINEGRDQ